MIPKPYIAKWQQQGPWKQFYQVLKFGTVC